MTPYHQHGAVVCLQDLHCHWKTCHQNTLLGMLQESEKTSNGFATYQNILLGMLQENEKNSKVFPVSKYFAENVAGK